MLAQLYGGAITAEIIDGMLDGSQARPVPDSQEVFTAEMEGIDVSFIIDLCESVDTHRPLIEAMQTHADDVQDEKSTELRELFTTEHEFINNREFVKRIEIVRRHEKAPLLLIFGLFRLPEFTTDVFLSFIATLSKDLNLEPPYDQDKATSELPSLIHRGCVAMEAFVTTFTVKDESLFG